MSGSKSKESPRYEEVPPSLRSIHSGPDLAESSMMNSAAVDCGWGRVIMAHTYPDPKELVEDLLRESRGRRDIAMYVADPQVLLSMAPQNLFLDPSDAFRIDLERPQGKPEGCADLVVRRVASLREAELLNDLYLKRDMVPTNPNFVWENRNSEEVVFLVAEDTSNGGIIGTVTGINHIRAFNDPYGGSSLWCLSVDPQASRPRIGELLVRSLADYFLSVGCRHMDLSVLHDNKQAKALYAKLGFRPLYTFAIKNKNAFNEPLFMGPELEEDLNPYARLLVDEARARGIAVEVLDSEEGYFRLTMGGKSVTCRESLTDLTSAVAMSRCADKIVTHRWLKKAGLRVPAFRMAGRRDGDVAFLEQCGRIVVKPAVGEQGQGITVGVASEDELEAALDLARRFSPRVLLESFHAGQDLRIIVIGYQVVAAAIRKPAEVVGDGVSDVRTLIEKQSRRRMAATGGESKIPLDEETAKCVADQDYDLGSVLPAGRTIAVRKTANLHTGGTIHDVTPDLHSELRAVAEKAARRLEIPVVGLDFIVESPSEPEYVILEANERPGLANHEPQPTAERFIDLLFPLSESARKAETPPGPGKGNQP